MTWRAVLVAPAVALLIGGCVRPRAAIDLGPLPRSVVLDARVLYYDVNAATLAELRRDMARRGPRWEGRPYQAVTQSRFRWEYEPERRDALCRPSRVRVVVSTIVVFPRWNQLAEPDSATLEWWHLLNAGLMEHEKGHAALSVRTAGDIARALEDMPPVACDSLARYVTEAGQRRMQAERQLQAQYDADTGHGATQIERVVRLRSP